MSDADSASSATGKLGELLTEYAEVERELADPAVHADAARARNLGRRFAELAPVRAVATDLETARDDLGAARELAGEDAAFAAEAETIATRIGQLEEQLRHLLLPKDPNDGKDVILEIKAGEGGDESALFAGDLLRMYSRYAERQGWTLEMLDEEATDLGGIKSVTLAVRSRRADSAVWANLKFEGGVHRVQRVPATESQGRIHTSAAGVLVLPEAEDVEVEIDPNDLRIDVYRSSGSRRAERQHHRLGGAHHARPHRHGREHAEREEPAAEPRGRHARAACPAARRRAGRGGLRRVRRPALAGPHRRPLGAGAHLQLRGEPDQRPPGGLQGLQPRPGPRRRPRRRHQPRCSRPTRRRCWPGRSPNGERDAGAARRRGRTARRGGRRQARGSTPSCCSRPGSRSRVRSCSLVTTSRTRSCGPSTTISYRRVHREPLQHITGVAPFRHLELRVGPGVFVPRPETELLVDARSPPHLRTPDRTTGSSTSAPGPERSRSAVADEVAGARVIGRRAVARPSLRWLSDNVATTDVGDSEVRVLGRRHR